MESLIESASCVTELQRAFQALADQAPGLDVDVVGHLLEDATLVHPVAGFEVVLSRPGDGVVTLYVSSNYGELCVRPADAAFSETAIRQSHCVHLSGGYRWGESEFPTAQGLAGALLGYMQYHLDAVAEPVV